MKRGEVLLTLRKVLLRRRDALRRVCAAELSLLGGHDDDEPHEEDIASRLAQGEHRELDAIEDALSRMREGQYGLCQQCGGTIPLARLQALPYAILCIQCQREMEGDRGQLAASPR